MHAQNSKAFKLLKFQTSYSEELIVLEGAATTKWPIANLVKAFLKSALITPADPRVE